VKKFLIGLVALLMFGYLTLLGLYVPYARTEAFKEGRTQGWHEGWPGVFAVNMAKHGSIKDTPWEEFTLEQKMLLCAYGSPGNRMSVDDINEIHVKFGPLGYGITLELIRSR